MPHDYLLSLLLIIGIDLILGGDNAVVIAIPAGIWLINKDSKRSSSERLSQSS